MLASGDSVEGFVVLEPIGAGGQATVWRARHVTSGAIVALKLMPLTGDERADTRARREARVLASLVHPSLVRCHRFFEDHRRRVLGMVLDWVDGTTLDRARADERWSATHLHAALTHVAAALAKLHDAGVVHRDIKGRNVLVSEAFFDDPLDPTTVKLADLGIATGVGNLQPLTSLKFIVGTPKFLPPETLRERDRADARPSRDIFALGVLGWWLVRGTHPTGLPADASLDELRAVYDEHSDADALWLPNDEADDAVTRVLRRCLRLDPELRPADGSAVLELLPPLPRRSLPKTAPLRAPTASAPAQRTQPDDPREDQASIIIRASAAPRPASPQATAATNRPIVVALAALGGCLLGGLAIFALYQALHGSTSDTEIDNHTSGTVPLPKRTRAPNVKLTIAAQTPSGATGAYRRVRSCAPNWPAPPTLEELTRADDDDAPLDPTAFKDDACEAEVLGSSSHCALTHRDGRWLRLRFFLKGGTRVSATSSDLEPIANPWPGGVDLYVALPPRRATVSITADGLWQGAHTLVLDPAAAKPMAFVELGPCRD